METNFASLRQGGGALMRDGGSSLFNKTNIPINQNLKNSKIYFSNLVNTNHNKHERQDYD